jgi:hypothetical protein
MNVGWTSAETILLCVAGLVFRSRVRVRDRRYSCEIRPFRHSINVTLDGCCDRREVFADEELHRRAAENLEQADALLFGRVTYEMMQEA